MNYKNYKNYLDDIYKDFFNESIIEKKERKEIQNINNFVEEIDKLYLDDNSKDIFKKIIKYMEDYNEEKESNYITFNILLETDNKKIVDQVSDILFEATSKYNYTKSLKVQSLSFYEIDSEEVLEKSFNSGIVIIKDLDVFGTLELPLKNKILYSLKENLSKEVISIVTDKKDSLNKFLLNDDSLERDYYSFRLVSIRPDTNDIYNKLVETLSSDLVNDKFRVDILDYINDTYKKSNLDYVSYMDNLVKYISFNKVIPKIDSIKSTDEIFKDLNELVGLNKVKRNLNELVDLISLKNKTSEDLKINNVNLHMVFLGNPGTGKTTVARMLCGILYDLKYIPQNKLIEVSPKDLVAEYVGQTGPKTMSIIEKAMGGVLFIDEAYTLADRGDSTYNAEAIATLIKAMEDYRDKFVVILAGYTKEMQGFLNSNSGIVSRIGYTLEFDDYTEEELKQIFIGMIKKSGFIIEDDALERFKEVVRENMFTKNFGNARFVRNVYEKTILKHASNTKDEKQSKTLKTITKEDINY